MSLGLSRRGLLSGLAGAGVGTRLLPFLPAAVRAADPPKRLLVIFTPMGYLESSFWPKKTPDGSDFTLGETMTALNDFKSKLIYPHGLLLYGAQWYMPDDDNEHGSGMAMCFTGSKKEGYATGPSIDAVVSDHLFATTKTKFKSLGLGVNAPSPSGHSSCFFSKAQTPVNAQNNPSAVFDLLFKDFTGGGVDQAAIARYKAQKQSVIDLVKGDIDRVAAKAGTADKEKMTAHLDGIRMIESRLQTDAPPVGAACTKPAAPAGGSLVANVSAQMDLITAAFACDLTRVATLQLGHCDGGLDMIPGINHHDTTHAVGDTKGGAGPIDNHKKIDRWFADRWAYLLRKLDGVKESNGSLLDNTLVLWGSDTSTQTEGGWGAHTFTRFPFWMAGGQNFAFKTGRYLTYPHPSNDGSTTLAKMWQSHNRLMVSIARAFGANINTFGTMDPGTGPLAQL